MKVVIIHNYYRQTGGEDLFVKAQIELLRGRGNEVIHFFKENLSISNFNLFQRISSIPQVIFSLKTYKEIKELIEREKPDIAHVHNVFPLISPSVYKALRDAKIPTVQTLHNFRFLCPNGLFYINGEICEKCKFGNTFHAVKRRCFRRSYFLSSLYAVTIGFHRKIGTFKNIEHFISPTQFVAQKYIESGLLNPEKISVIPNFIFRGDVKNNLKKKEGYFLYMGRLSEEKGLKNLLEIIEELPYVSFKIAGDGPLKPHLLEFIKKKNLRNIEYLGFISGKEKDIILGKSLALILPSLCYEVFPLICPEAMANATPIIASNKGSLPFIVEDGKSGLIFNSEDKGDFKNKILYLWKNPEIALDMGRYGREKFEIEYSEDVHYNKLIKIYEGLKAKKSKA